MTPTEAEAILTKVVAYTGQYTDTNAPKAWAEALADISFADASTAATRLGTRPLEPGKAQTILPSHLIWEVRKLRQERMDRYHASQSDPPPGLTPPEYIRWLRGELDRAAAGLPPRKQPELQRKPARELISQIRKGVA